MQERRGQLRYIVYSQDTLIALLGFGAAAWHEQYVYYPALLETFIEKPR